MKKLFLMALLAVSVLSCANRSKTAAGDAVADSTAVAEPTEPQGNNVLIAFFSATGTTRAVAEKMVHSFEADLYEIIPAEPYSEADLDWRNAKSRSSVEMKDAKARPVLGNSNIRVSKYELVYLGYPIWWGVAPRIINSFIESQQWDSVRVIPFATSGGSPVEPSVEALRKSYPEIRFEDGILLNNVREDGLCGEIEE
ncbi:MAG: flavodoxin [Bacteroidaceae bacterium]|nr:flavodoxin [Bacteroidaceae bacterium]